MKIILVLVFFAKAKIVDIQKEFQKPLTFVTNLIHKLLRLTILNKKLKILTKKSLLTFITRTGIILSKARAWLLYCLIKTETYNINHYTYWLDIPKKIGTPIYTIQYKNMADLLLRIMMKTMKMAMSRMVIMMRMRMML